MEARIIDQNELKALGIETRKAVEAAKAIFSKTAPNSEWVRWATAWLADDPQATNDDAINRAFTTAMGEDVPGFNRHGTEYFAAVAAAYAVAELSFFAEHGDCILHLSAREIGYENSVIRTIELRLNKEVSAA